MQSTSKPRGHDLRKGRVSLPEHAYAITTVVRDRRPLFSDLRAGRILVNALRFHHDRGTVESLAFVVMPDHLHWLVRLREPSLGNLMDSVKRHSAREVNRLLDLTGWPLWQEGYYDRAMREEDDLRAAARYIVANPLRAGLVTRLGDYPLWDAIWL